MTCEPAGDLGANSIVVRQFQSVVGTPNDAFAPNGFASYLAGIHHANGKDCATSTQAYGKWEIAGSHAGFLVCYTDNASGDALLYWTYAAPGVLVRAVNQKGDASALYAFFAKYAKFIAP